METQQLVEANTLRVLNEIKMEIRSIMDLNPSFAGNEYDYCEISGMYKAFEKCIEIINEKTQQL